MPSWRLNHPSTLAATYALNGNALDGTGRYPGTLVNAPTWADGPRGRQCIEFDGDDAHVNIGDVTQLNSVSAFTICFWMNQDVFGVTDTIFHKTVDATHEIRIYVLAPNILVFSVRDGLASHGYFDYTGFVSALNWHHVAMVFDGSGALNPNRVKIYIDGVPMTLLFSSIIPAATADLFGIDALIGNTANSFDGKFYDWRIHSCALSRDEIIAIIHESVPVLA